MPSRWRFLILVDPSYARREADPRYFWRVHSPAMLALLLVNGGLCAGGFTCLPLLPLALLIGGHLVIFGLAVHLPLYPRAPVTISTVLVGYNLVATAGLAALVQTPSTPLWLFHLMYVFATVHGAAPSYLVALLAASLPPAVGLLWHGLGVVPFGDSLGVLSMISLASSVGYVAFCNLHGVRREAEAEKAALQERVIAAEERQRIARELHDSLGAALCEVRLWHEAALGGDEQHRKTAIERAQKRAGVALSELRSFVSAVDRKALAQPELEAVLRRELHAFCEAAGVDLALQLSWPSATAQEAAEVTAVVREAVHNAVRHGGPRKIAVRVAAENGLVIEVHDDGRGFDERRVARGRGLRSLEERARRLNGELELKSSPGRGTRVCLRVPVESESSG